MSPTARGSPDSPCLARRPAGSGINPSTSRAAVLGCPYIARERRRRPDAPPRHVRLCDNLALPTTLPSPSSTPSLAAATFSLISLPYRAGARAGIHGVRLRGSSVKFAAVPADAAITMSSINRVDPTSRRDGQHRRARDHVHVLQRLGVDGRDENRCNLGASQQEGVPHTSSTQRFACRHPCLQRRPSTLNNALHIDNPRRRSSAVRRETFLDDIASRPVSRTVRAHVSIPTAQSSAR